MAGMSLFRTICFLLAWLNTSTAWIRHFESLSSTLTKSRSCIQNTFAVAIASTIVATSLSPLPCLADRPLNAPTAAGTRVNSDPDSLLRYGLPIKNKEIRSIQASVDSIKLNLKTRRISFATSDSLSVKDQLVKNEDKILKDVPSNKVSLAKTTITKMKDDIVPLIAAITEENNSGSGSLQQRKGLDDAFAAQDQLAKDLNVLGELMVPDDFKRNIPSEYNALPRLNRRATVEMVIVKEDGSQFNVDGNLLGDVRLTMIIDGYNAPLTGGNFIDLINNNFYAGKKINRADGFVVQTGDADPEGIVHGYVPKGSTEERKIPLEIAIKGDDELLYGSTTEDEMRGASATILPFQAYGALGMARSEFEADSASSQFFWLLFESDLTPAGKNLLDGRYACFGYTVDGADQLKAVREGDIIKSAKVVDGLTSFVVGK